MFTVYAEREIFESIILSNSEIPHWHEIFSHHAAICLNMTDADLNAENVEGTVIYEFIKATDSLNVYALNEMFDSFYDDKFTLLHHSRSVFFLNITDSESENIQRELGVLAYGGNYKNNCHLKGTYFSTLYEGSIFEDGSSRGWKKLVKSLPSVVSNAMVISDSYLFDNEQNGENIGVINTIQLIDSLLPSSLSIPYHIMIFSNDNPGGERAKAPYSHEKCKNIVNKLKIGIKALRNYDIICEVVFSKTMHKRIAILNYINITCDKGFALFKIDDNKTIRSRNDIRATCLFNNKPNEGESEYLVAETTLSELKKDYLSICQWISNQGQSTHNRIFGDVDDSISLQNRLLK